MEFFHKQTNFPFMATRKVWYGLSAVLMVICFVSFATRGLNYAIDFTGGVSVEAKFPQAVEVEKVRSALQGAGFNEPEVQSFGSSQDVRIRLPPMTGQGGDVIRARIDTALKGIDPGAQIAQLEVVGPQVGAELRTSAIWALSFTVLLIFIYLAFRFHTWRLSAGAILAVIGYSLNDTVVVFDRIRERFEASRRLAPAIALDQAVNQTLSRTIMTKVVTSIVVVALLFLGGPVLRGFSEALLIGILAGTYSSIWISSAVALDFGLKAEHVFPTVKKTAVDHLP